MVSSQKSMNLKDTTIIASHLNTFTISLEAWKRTLYRKVVSVPMVISIFISARKFGIVFITFLHVKKSYS